MTGGGPTVTASNVIMVMSGKGGVGKSTTAAHLGAGLASRGYRVGVMDADLTGPSTPWIFKSESSVYQSSMGWVPVYVDREKKLGIMSIGFLAPNKLDAVILRGPRKTAIITRFVQEVYWGEIDYLIVDTPPGVGDEQLSIARLLNEHPRLGAVLVTTPQLVSLAEVAGQIPFCKCAGIKIIGILENMGAFKCPNCAHCSDIFPTGAVQEFARKQNMNILGSVGLDPELSDVFKCTSGTFSLEEYAESQVSGIFSGVVDQVEKYFSMLE